MNKKYTIIFQVNAHYPNIIDQKISRKLSKDFDQWLQDWAKSSCKDIMPVLYEPSRDKNSGNIEHVPVGDTKIEITMDINTTYKTLIKKNDCNE